MGDFGVRNFILMPSNMGLWPEIENCIQCLRRWKRQSNVRQRPICTLHSLTSAEEAGSDHIREVPKRSMGPRMMLVKCDRPRPLVKQEVSSEMNWTSATIHSF